MIKYLLLSLTLISKSVFADVAIDKVQYLNFHQYDLVVYGGYVQSNYTVSYYRKNGAEVNKKFLCSAPSDVTSWCSGNYTLPDVAPGDYLVISSSDGSSSPKYPVDTAHFPYLYPKPTPLPKPYKAASISVKTETTASGQHYEIYANGANEAPLFVKVESATTTPIPALVLQASIVFYNENTGKILNISTSAKPFVVNYWNNSFDASIQSIDNSYRSASSEQNVTNMEAYFTATKTSLDIPICARITNPDGSVVSTCDEGVHAPAYVTPISVPPITNNPPSAICVFRSGDHSNMSDYADYYRFNFSIGSHIDPIKSFLLGNFQYEHPSDIHDDDLHNDTFLFEPQNFSHWDMRTARQKATFFNASRWVTWGALFVQKNRVVTLKVTNAGDGDSYSYPNFTNPSGNTAYLITETNTDGGTGAWGNVNFNQLTLLATDIYGNKINLVMHDFAMSCPSTIGLGFSD